MKRILAWVGGIIAVILLTAAAYFGLILWGLNRMQ